MVNPKFDDPIVSIEQAKIFFKHMGCSDYHMGREYPERYWEYRQLNIPVQIENEWIEEEFHENYETIKGGKISKLPLWLTHSIMYDLFESYKTHDLLEKILEITNLIRNIVPNLDRVKVAETINGRTIHQVRRGLIFISFDMGQRKTAHKFIKLSLHFSQCKLKEIDEKALAEISINPLSQYLEHQDSKTNHLKRCEQARRDCIEIRKELGL